MNDLEKYFRLNDKRLIHKWNHYFEVYDRHFSKYRNKDIVILEIGVSHGGSLQMWKDYFGDKAKIYGIDINPQCKEFEEENIKIFIGSQSDRNFLREVKAQIPPIDILIDDGGHTMVQQILVMKNYLIM
jgi:cephalosporin hydroxylase